MFAAWTICGSDDTQRKKFSPNIVFALAIGIGLTARANRCRPARAGRRTSPPALVDSFVRTRRADALSRPAATRPWGDRKGVISRTSGGATRSTTMGSVLPRHRRGDCLHGRAILRPQDRHGRSWLLGRWGARLRSRPATRPESDDGYTCSISRRRSSRLRACGSSSALRSRIDFGVTSTSSSSSM